MCSFDRDAQIDSYSCICFKGHFEIRCGREDSADSDCMDRDDSKVEEDGSYLLYNARWMNSSWFLDAYMSSLTSLLTAVCHNEKYRRRSSS